MSAYETVVVGTDGSESSLRAVERAARIAGDGSLVIACAYEPADERRLGAADDALKDEAYQLHGGSPAGQILRTASARAKAAGAANVTERPIAGQPVDALLRLAAELKAELIVVGNKGLNSLSGRLLGSVPSDVSKKSRTDVLIVHTVG